MSRAAVTVFVLVLFVRANIAAQESAGTNDKVFETLDGYFALTSGSGYIFSSWQHIESVPINLRLAGYYAASPKVHLGGFLGYRLDFGKDWGLEYVHTFLLGASGRFGKASGDSTWLGFELSLALSLLREAIVEKPDKSKPGYYSVFIIPGFVMLHNLSKGPVSLNLEFQAGAELILGGRVKSKHEDVSKGSPIMSIGPTAHLGLVVGF